MRLWMFAFAAILLAGPALAAGGGGHGASASGGASNRYQATWTLAVPEGSATGETEIVYGDHAEDDAHAEEEDHAAPASHGAEGDASTEDPQIVEMPIVVAPIVVGGELVNYAFVTARLDVNDGHDPWAVREQTAYIRDSMLRAAHQQPLNDADNRRAINASTADRVWTAAANRVLGEGVVGAVHVVSSDVRYPDLAGAR